MSVTGTTRLFGIVGEPVAPLRSPALFNAAFALARAGAARLTLHDAAPERAAALAATLSAHWPELRAVAGEADPAGHDIVVNATPMGLHAGDPPSLPVASLRPGQVVADVIPNPEITPLLDAARARGCAVVTGRAMHEGQARLAAAYLGIAGWDG